ncbi:unnamed protein product [Cylicostephanus goldi]|uniref:Serine-threonine/tyrosine-protein kinase catalytic domain-containing protein n=1 Tax=Cylicostephanus goldi TaxID=71465 RepID=A0A3P7M8S9_CYLGO|nr:unnamed protein product [Cylicostephanus goldi]
MQVSQKWVAFEACVTVNWEEIRDHVIHFRVLGESRLFTLDGNFRNTNIIDLVKFHLESGSPIADEVKLLRPIPKQRWELTKDKLTMGEELGHGEFGEVYAGKLKEGLNREIDVAIKKVSLVKLHPDR